MRRFGWFVYAVLAVGCQRSDDPGKSPTRDVPSESPSPRSEHGRAPAQPLEPAPGGPAVPAQSAQELALPLAKIGDVTITLGELQERLNRQSPYIRARYTSPQQKRDFLDQLVRFEILAKEAYRRGYDKDPEVVRTMKQTMIQKLMRDELDAKITGDSIKDADMKAYYDANVGEFVKPDEVRASAIILKNKAQADRVLLEAKGEAGRTNTGFRGLVEKYSSDEETKLRAGDLRYFDPSTKDVPAPVVKAAFALVNIGDVSGVVDAGNGTFYILKQTGRHKSMTRSFDDAKPIIRNKLFREQRFAAEKTFVDSLESQAKIEIDDANLAKVRIDTTNAQGDGHGINVTPPPALPVPTTVPAALPTTARAGSAAPPPPPGSAEQPVP